jgi:ribosomal protein S18 acetylase RimI-like enzyme
MRIDPLCAADAAAVGALLSEPGDVEGRHFDGLPSDPEALFLLLFSVKRDRYWAIRDDSQLLGVFMLRGFDSDYEVPAFGVVIKAEARGCGLGRVALSFAESWCRRNQVREMMLTVSPQNRRALGLYESCGFQRTDEVSPKGNLIFRKPLR